MSAGRRTAALACSPARVRGGKSPDVLTIRTGYPYQTLQLVPENAELPAFSLWVAYVPEDAEQRTNHVYGLLMIEKPPIPGALHLAWPFIRRFTERVFAEDRMAVEAEQRAWDEQGEDWNHEVFPLILEVRDVLRTNGVPIHPESVLLYPSRARNPAPHPDTRTSYQRPPLRLRLLPCAWPGLLSPI